MPEKEGPKHIDPPKNIVNNFIQSKKIDEAKARSQQIILQHNIFACSDHRLNSNEIDDAIADSKAYLNALNATSTLQEMLISQMTSIHLLQQKAIGLASRTGITDSNQSYTNAAIKLTNCFTQQAALLAKLQGFGSQKITVEHVEIHQGGQAIVGNVSTIGGGD